ncbi:MAG: hypothetical protein WC802_05630 [Patescibacteria group bacterium]|jgi:predicted RNase H-like HicB family nuclease
MIIFREGDAFVAYMPELDLSSVGSTEDEARRMMAEAAEAFSEEMLKLSLG